MASFVVLGVVVLLAGLVSSRVVGRLADRQESAVPLAVFRIAFGCVLFFEVAQMLFYARLISDPVPYLVPGEIRLTYLLLVWLAAILCVIFGLWTRGAAAVSYVAGLGTVSVFHDFEYHFDHIIVGMNLMLVVAPVGRRLSLDAWRAARRQGTAAPPGRPAEVSALYRKLVVLLGIALVYFDSTFWKLSSPMWTSGLGVWMPAVLPQVTWYDFSAVLDHEWVVKGLGYTTLVVEALFIVLMWFEVVSVPLAVVGLGLHLGIAAVFPIPWFGLGVAAIYALVLPPRLYGRMGRRRLTVTASRLGEPAAAGPSAPGVPGATTAGTRLGLGVLLTVMLVCQAAAIAQSPVFRGLAGAAGAGGLASELAVYGARLTDAFARPFLGITPHGVFLDGHFRGYNHIIAVVYVDPGGKEVWLPLTRPSGHAHWLNSGRVWVFWTWRCAGPTVTIAQLGLGVKRVTAFWMHRMRIPPLADATFRVLAKRIEVPTRWERGFLRGQQEQPWTEIGVATWKKGSFQAMLKEVEAL